MLGLNSGLLGVRRVPTVSSASGLWVPNEQSLAKRAAIWPVSGDLYFADVSLLLHMDGSNGSTTFTDSSNNALTVTANGNAQISTAQSKFGGASGYFDGNGDYLSGTLASAIGTAEFTAEAWVRIASSRNYRMILETRNNDSTSAGFVLGANSSAQLFLFTNSGFRITGGTLSLNTWHHVALVRSAGVFKIYLDGTALAGSYTSSANLSLAGFRIGMDWANLHPWDGYIDDLRITKGVARYTADFTPPTAAFPND